MLMLARIAGLVLLLALAAGAPGAQAPRRIVSLSLCSDELVLLLAERERIASLSYLAADPRYSSFAAQAAGLPLNQARAEEVLALEPDLILSSRFSASATVSLLRRLNHEVEVLDFPATFEEAHQQIRRVAALLGEEQRGEALIARMRREIAAARQALPTSSRGSLALFYDGNGISYGSGTLRHYFLESLGWRNLAAERGLAGPAPLQLEILLQGRPDFLLVDGGDDGPLAHPMTRHPALRAAFEPDQILQMPASYFQCAGPSLARAFARLAEQLKNAEPGAQ